jgi:hypothetical protein
MASHKRRDRICRCTMCIDSIYYDELGVQQCGKQVPASTYRNHQRKPQVQPRFSSPSSDDSIKDAIEVERQTLLRHGEIHTYYCPECYII